MAGTLPPLYAATYPLSLPNTVWHVLVLYGLPMGAGVSYYCPYGGVRSRPSHRWGGVEPLVHWYCSGAG